MQATNNKSKSEVMKNPRVTAAQLKAENVKMLKKGVHSHYSTPSPKGSSHPYGIPAHKPRLNERMLRARLDFSKKYKHLTIEQ